MEEKKRGEEVETEKANNLFEKLHYEGQSWVQYRLETGTEFFEEEEI